MTSLHIILWELQIACVRRSCIGVFRLASETWFMACEFKFRYVFAFASVILVLRALQPFLRMCNLWIWFWVFMRCWGSVFNFLLDSFDFGHNSKFHQTGMWVVWVMGFMCIIESSWQDHASNNEPFFVRGGYHKFAKEDTKHVNACEWGGAGGEHCLLVVYFTRNHMACSLNIIQMACPCTCARPCQLRYFSHS